MTAADRLRVIGAVHRELGRGWKVRLDRYHVPDRTWIRYLQRDRPRGEVWRYWRCSAEELIAAAWSRSIFSSTKEWP